MPLPSFRTSESYEGGERRSGIQDKYYAERTLLLMIYFYLDSVSRISLLTQWKYLHGMTEAFSLAIILVIYKILIWWMWKHFRKNSSLTVMNCGEGLRCLIFSGMNAGSRWSWRSWKQGSSLQAISLPWRIVVLHKYPNLLLWCDVLVWSIPEENGSISIIPSIMKIFS